MLKYIIKPQQFEQCGTGTGLDEQFKVRKVESPEQMQECLRI